MGRIEDIYFSNSEIINKMNRRARVDSKQSLDVILRLRDSDLMITQPYQLYVERVDPAKNMARYYAMAIDQTIFGETCLIRRWGRIGRRGQEKQHVFKREEEAVSLFLDLLKHKRARGYLPRTAFSTRKTDPDRP
jgi:predicted DNA-binding WGR domain protein